MFEFKTKDIPTLFVVLEGEDIEVGVLLTVLEMFSVDDFINDYNLDRQVADILVKIGVLRKKSGSRNALLYCKTDKYKSFYKDFWEAYGEGEA